MVEVNKEIKKLYINILRKMLREPEKWTNGGSRYLSPYVNQDTRTRFETKCVFNNSVYIYENNHEIYELKFDFFDFKTPWLVSRLRKYHRNIEKETIKNETDEKLMKALGHNSTRFFKLMKIKSKI